MSETENRIRTQEDFVEQQRRMGTKIFFMNHADIVFAKPGERSAIATYGLGGCTGIAIQFENPKDPSQKGAIVAHYSPMTIQANKHIAQFGSLLETISIREAEASAIIVHPGDEDAYSPTGYSAWSYYDERVEGLSRFIRDKLGEKIQIITAGYYEIGRGGNRNPEQGAIIVEFPADRGAQTLRIGGFKVDI